MGSNYALCTRSTFELISWCLLKTTSRSSQNEKIRRRLHLNGSAAVSSRILLISKTVNLLSVLSATSTDFMLPLLLLQNAQS